MESYIYIIISVLPSLAAIIGIVASIIKMIKDNKAIVKPVIEQFEELRKEVKDKTEMTDAKETIQMLLQENASLRKEIADLITAISKIKYDT